MCMLKIGNQFRMEYSSFIKVTVIFNEFKLKTTTTKTIATQMKIFTQTKCLKILPKFVFFSTLQRYLFVYTVELKKQRNSRVKFARKNKQKHVFLIFTNKNDKNNNKNKRNICE